MRFTLDITRDGIALVVRLSPGECPDVRFSSTCMRHAELQMHTLRKRVPKCFGGSSLDQLCMTPLPKPIFVIKKRNLLNPMGNQLGPQVGVLRHQGSGILPRKCVLVVSLVEVPRQSEKMIRRKIYNP